MPAALQRVVGFNQRLRNNFLLVLEDALRGDSEDHHSQRDDEREGAAADQEKVLVDGHVSGGGRRLSELDGRSRELRGQAG